MKSNRIKLCKEKACGNEQTTQGYCRVHYMKNWKQILKDKAKDEEKKEKAVGAMADRYSDDSVPSDDFNTEIGGKNSPLSELGLKEKDLKRKDGDGNPFSLDDLDMIIDNMKYDDNY